MDASTLCRRYGLGASHRAAPIHPGTVAQVWQASTPSGEVVIRTLTDRAQGEREFLICRHLARQGFRQTPAILTADSGAPAVEQDGTWYQIQQYLPGVRPDPAVPGVPGEIARTAARLEAALETCPPIRCPADRFDLAAAWAEGRQGWSQLGLPLSLSQADREVQHQTDAPTHASQVIHGDMGLWNLLLDPNGTIWVIDFGEARMGDPYFDIASLLCGLLHQVPPERRWQTCSEFLAAYGEQSPLDRCQLAEQMELWEWRALAQCARQGAAMAAAAAGFLHTLVWVKENLWTIN